MRSPAGHRALWFLVRCSLIWFACTSANGAPQDYPHAYKALMEDYRAQMIKLTVRPLPPKSLPKTQRRVALAQQVEDVAKANTEFARELNALKPPAKFRETHITTIQIFQVVAADNHRWAEAIRHGNRAMRDRIARENEVHELKAMQRMQQALKRAGGSSWELQAVISELQQDSKKP